MRSNSKLNLINYYIKNKLSDNFVDLELDERGESDISENRSERKSKHFIFPGEF